jgi:hypothetical protein
MIYEEKGPRITFFDGIRTTAPTKCTNPGFLTYLGHARFSEVIFQAERNAAEGGMADARRTGR